MFNRNLKLSLLMNEFVILTSSDTGGFYVLTKKYLCIYISKLLFKTDLTAKKYFCT